MSTVANSRKLALAGWLLTCPLLLAIAVLVLPRFNLYGTPAERYTLLALLAAPVIGAIGIIRYEPCTLPVRMVLIAGYLVAGLVLALFAAVFVGCSWAGACF